MIPYETTVNAPSATVLARLGVRLWTWLAAAAERHRQRRSLAALNDHQLADIGLTHEDAQREAAKPFWLV